MGVTIFRVVAVFIMTIFMSEVSALVGRVVLNSLVGTVVLNRLLVAVVVAIRVQGSRFVVARVLMMSGVSRMQFLRPAITVMSGNFSPIAVVRSLVLVIVRSAVVSGGDMVGLSLVVVVRVMVRV